MYSAVLMLALTAGSEAVDFGNRGCSTCSCTYAAPVYVSSCSCSTSCHGGLFSRMRDRRCHGSSACHCPPVCTCTVYSCTCTAPVVAPPPPVKKEMPKGEKIEAPKKASLNVPATIVVSLPADARLIVDGTPTTSTSDRRTLVTPVLENGATYVYTMQAEVTREGRVMTQSQQVTVRGGETSNVQFNFSAQSVASR